MIILFIISIGTIVYQDNLIHCAEYWKKINALIMKEEFELLPDSISIEHIKSEKIIFLGNINSKFFKRYSKLLPFRASGDTVFINDTSIVAQDFIIHCKFNDTMGKEVELIAVNDFEAITGVSDLFGYDFTISRKRDGMMYLKDVLCYGKLHWGKDSSLKLSEIKWNCHITRDLEIAYSKHFKLYFDKKLIFTNEANTILQLLETMYECFTEEYQIYLPETIFVYIYENSILPKEFSCYSNPFNTMWLQFQSRAGLLKPTKGSPVYTIAHEMARISLQPLSNEYPPAIGADDWSHYAPLCGIVPCVHKKLGKSAWLSFYDYQSYGIPLFEKIYRGGENTYAWLLYEIDRRYGKKLIGKGIKSVIKDKYWRHPEMKNLMDTLAKLTNDKDLIAKVKNAYPTPFEHSLSRWKRWQDFGFRPTLEDMFIFEDRFVIDSVIPGSTADSLGFCSGDEILFIDDCDLKICKSNAYKNLLYKNKGDTIFFTITSKKNHKFKKIAIIIN